MNYRFLKKFYKILLEDVDGKDWENAKIYEALDFEDAAEKYAKDYYEECCGEWRSDDAIFLLIRQHDHENNSICRLAVYFEYEPNFNARIIEPDEL